MSYSVATILDMTLLTLIFIVLAWSNFKKGKTGKTSSIILKKSKTLSLIVSTLFVVLLVAITLEFLSPTVAFVATIPLVIILGMLLFILPLVSKKTALHVIIVVMIVFFLLVPKISVLYHYSGGKLGADPWYHLSDIIDLSGTNTTQPVNYYSVFPIVYAHSLFLLETIGIDAFYIPTIYYIVINLLTALILYKAFQILVKLLEREKKTTVNIPLPLIAVLIYSVLQYPNIAILRELPQAVGFLSVCLGFYLLLKIQYTRDRRFVILGIFVALLSLAHPFAPLFLTGMFLSCKILNRLGKGAMNLPTLSFVLLPFLMEILYFMMLPIFNESIGSFVRNLANGVQILFGFRSQGMTRFGEVSMDLKYPTTFESLLNGLNWAFPVAVVLSFILVFVVKVIKNREIKLSNNSDIFIHGCAFFSLALAGLAFAFTPVEYAFARYFGGYAVIMAIPVIVHMLGKVLQKRNAIKGIVIIVIMLTAFAMWTDYDYYPNLQVNGIVDRNRLATSEIVTTSELYAAQFITNTVAPDGRVLVERTYLSTFSFYAHFSQSPSTKIVIESVNYPITMQDIRQFALPLADQYIVLRGQDALENLSSLLVGVIYSSGEVWELMIP